MRELYPEIEPRINRELKLNNVHTMNITEYGNPNGIPVVVLHGGPGSGCRPYYSQYFNSDDYRIVLYDQRGSGKSTPKFSLQDNTTQHLVEDLNKLRVDLVGEEGKVLLFGGSWGAALAILYAESYPDNCLGLILRGTFLGRKQDSSAFLRDDCQAALNNPPEWKRFKSHVFANPEGSHSFEEIITAYYEKAKSDDQAVWMPAASAFTLWEKVNSFTDEEQIKQAIEWSKDNDDAKAMGRIEIHYMANDIFLEPNQIVDRIHLLKDLPIYFVQGIHDNICPKDQTELLVGILKDADAKFITPLYTDAGHSISEIANIDGLVKACDDFAQKHKSEYFLKTETSNKYQSPIWKKPDDKDDSQSYDQFTSNQIT